MTKAPDDLPRSPSGRIPAWVVEEQHGLVRDTTWRSYSPHPVERRSSRPHRRGWLAVAAVGISTLVLGGFAAHAGLGAPASPALALAHPRPGREEAAGPLGRPPVVRQPAASFAFLQKLDDGRPVTYDPCRPIHYVTRAAGQLRNGSALIRDGVQRLSAVTGLRFVDDGTTDEAPSSQRRPFQPARYGARWAPVLIAWQSAQENPDFAADVAGEAGSQTVQAPGEPPVYVTGQVMLDTTKIGMLTSDPHGAAQARAIVLHELGHLVGLAHVNDRTQIMYPRANAVVRDYAGGDLTGLARLGAGSCAPWL